MHVFCARAPVEGREESENRHGGQGRARGQQFEGQQVLCLEQGAPTREGLPREGVDLASDRHEKRTKCHAK